MIAIELTAEDLASSTPPPALVAWLDSLAAQTAVVDIEVVS